MIFTFATTRPELFPLTRSVKSHNKQQINNISGPINKAELALRLQNLRYLTKNKIAIACTGKGVEESVMKKVLLLSCLLAASAFVGCGGGAGNSSQGATPASLLSRSLSPANPG